jgi:acetoin:2,6-dichlorophenolindophenol oxidoreductase subunit beta
MTRLRMNQAIALAMADEMERDPRVFLMGEDVAEAEGVFKTSEGLVGKFGPDRVRDTPISEMGFLGAGVGAAATGLRPVVEIMFIEFMGVALDQLVTEGSLLHYLSAGELTVPLVVRASVGAGLGFGCQHSQTLERWFLGTPGLKLAVASGARSAYGLLCAAIRDDNPVLLLEPRALYGRREDFNSGEAGILPLGIAEVLHSGTDVTVVALGQTVGVALEAVLASSNWSADVIDLHTLMPWDRSTILTSVAKTGRLVIVEENQFTGGWGTELASFLACEGFSLLKAPIIRITAPDVPVPYGAELESRYIPSAGYVRSQIDELMRTGSAPKHWWEGGE